MLRYAITAGRERGLGDQTSLRALVERCRALGLDGIDCIVVREKHLSAGALVEVCRQVKAVADGARVLVSARPDVAAAAGLDGVHLTAAAGELTPSQVRRILPGAWVSVSCHTADAVRHAVDVDVDGRADAILFAPVFGKTVDGVKVTQATGLDALREACSLAGGLPVLALGGVNAGNAAACMQAGAAGIAAIRMFFEGEGVSWK